MLIQNMHKYIDRFLIIDVNLRNLYVSHAVPKQTGIILKFCTLICSMSPSEHANFLAL